MVRERKKEERERKEKFGRKRCLLYFTVFAHVLHFKIKYVRVISKYELSS